MRKIAFMPLLCLLISAGAHAQSKFNTYGAFGFGLIAPQGNLKNDFNSGFQASAEINGKLFTPVWFYLGGTFQSFSAANSATTGNTQGLSTLGINAGFKIFPVKFFYVNGGAGLLAVVSQQAPTTTDLYFNVGAGIFPLKFLGIFASYNMWQQQSGSANNYLVAGVQIALGRR